MRAFLPQAESAEVIIDGKLTPMVKQHERGFFVASLTGEIRKYRIQAKLWSGTTVEFEDPYRFWPQISDYDLYLHGEGTNHESYHMLGAHLASPDGVEGVRFAVWAPNALVVSVVGEFNQWDTRRHPMRRRNGGVWEIFLPGLGDGAAYKYNVRSQFQGYQQLKADPYAFCLREFRRNPPRWCGTRSIPVEDAAWMETAPGATRLEAPFSVYEVHLESWLRGPQGQLLTYREMAEKLVEYVKRHGLHAHRTAAHHGVSVLRIVGLPGDRLLRAHRRASARRTISCISSIAATRRASA